MTAQQLFAQPAQTIFNNQFFSVQIFTHLNEKGQERYEFQIINKISNRHCSDLRYAARKSTSTKWAMKQLAIFAKQQHNAINSHLSSNYSVSELIAA